ncbi:MAG: NAD-dependent deacetylase [Treponema sp.]|jgi:NAD-dependent deacetylase|nr:NAD-dependent deacetylase [Treponema sp.]
MQAPPGRDALFQMVREARHCAALTGAGISVLSGIPDFRGAAGLYRSGSVDWERCFDSAYFEEDPGFFYTSAGPWIYRADAKEPSAVHRTLADWEGRGFLKGIITQNIDMLHQKAGSRRVIELHGSPNIHYCLRCPGIRLGFSPVAALVKAGALPRCPKCGAVLKPGISFFGDPLPWEARREAETEAQDADLLLILGTSLRVFPAGELPRTTLRRGGSLVIVNNQPTPFDGAALLRLEDLAEVFGG